MVPALPRRACQVSSMWALMWEAQPRPTWTEFLGKKMKNIPFQVNWPLERLWAGRWRIEQLRDGQSGRSIIVCPNQVELIIKMSKCACCVYILVFYTNPISCLCFETFVTVTSLQSYSNKRFIIKLYNTKLTDSSACNAKSRSVRQSLSITFWIFGFVMF